jgi:hypothetical protein
MTVVQSPQKYCFASMMDDFIIDGDSSINFAIKYKGQKILDENYCPDGNYQIRIRQLGKLCRMALWGVWYGSSETAQANVYGDFEFYINDALQQTSTIIFARLATSMKASPLITSGGALERTFSKNTRRGVPEWITLCVPANTIVESQKRVAGKLTDKKTIRVAATSFAIITLNVSSDTLYPAEEVDGYQILVGTSAFEYTIDSREANDIQVMRYKNIFDCPVTAIFRGGITQEGDNTSETADIAGITRKAMVTPKDSFTYNSGVFYKRTDYLIYHDIANAQEVSVLAEDGTWVPVIINKQSFKRYSNRTFEEVAFTLTPADPEQETLLL